MDFDRYFWQQRELQRALKDLQPAIAALNAPPPSFLDEIRRLQVLSEHFTLPPSYISIFNEIQRALRPTQLDLGLTALADINRALTRDFAHLNSRMAEVAAQLAQPVNSAALAAQAMADSLVPTEALLRLGRLEPPLFDLTFRPHLAFERFATSKIAFAREASEAFRANSLRTIAGASELLPHMAQGSELAILLALPQSDDDSNAPEVNVFSALDGELSAIDLEDPEAPIESAVDGAVTSGIVNNGARLIRLVHDLNVEAEREGREPVFKPTSTTMLAFHVIPCRVAEDETSFSEVVDFLYFLLYEGSGNATRILTMTSREVLDPLWRLKHLRLGFRHDVDHGDPNDIRKKFESVGAAYRALIGREVPRTREDWLNAQHHLYCGLVTMLEKVWYGGALGGGEGPDN